MKGDSCASGQSLTYRTRCGRTAIITGANTGLGYETAAALAASGARVVLAVRNLEKGENALRRIREAYPAARVELQVLDLCSLASVRAAAEALKSNLDTIDLLINNAGVVLAPKSTTADNFEMHFGTNHLSHFALTGLLLDRMLATPGSRVVTVSSLGHRLSGGIRFDDAQWEREYSRFGAYGQSKLANLLFTYELQRRCRAAGLSQSPRIPVVRTPSSVVSCRRHSASSSRSRDRYSRSLPLRVRCRRCAQRLIRRCSVGNTSVPTG